MCGKDKFLTQHVLFLITFHLATEHLDTKPSSREHVMLIFSCVCVCVSAVEPARHFTCKSTHLLMKGYYNIFKVSPEDVLSMQRLGGLISSSSAGLIGLWCNPSHTHTHQGASLLVEPTSTSSLLILQPTFSRASSPRL